MSQLLQQKAEQMSADPLKGHAYYEKLKDLNKGSYGFVQLARNKETRELVAVKFIERGGTVTKYVERELLNHSDLLHPHIIQFKEVFLTTDYLAIVMEYAEGGDMFQHVKKNRGLSEDEARWFFQQLITGLDYCHKALRSTKLQKGVVSRDIKLENTLLDASRRPLIKICDFGYSKHENDSLPKSKVGTPGYTAPEIITDRMSYDGVGADTWSAGVQLYVMLFCQYPFERSSDDQLKPEEKIKSVLQRIVDVKYSFPSGIPVSKDCKDLISRILVKNPAKRYSISQIQNHSWYLKSLPPGLNAFNDQCLAHQRAAGSPWSKDGLRAILREAKMKAGHHPQLEDNTDAYSVDYMIDDEMVSSGY